MGAGLRAGLQGGEQLASGDMHIYIVALAVSTPTGRALTFYAFHWVCGKRLGCSRLVKPVQHYNYLDIDSHPDVSMLHARASCSHARCEGR